MTEPPCGPLRRCGEGNPFSAAATALIATMLLFGAMVLVGEVGGDLLRRVIVVLFAFSLVGVFATVCRCSGFRRFYLFAGGMVRWANGRIKVFSWDEVNLVQRHEAVAGAARTV